jgi:hypothetical protein
VETLLTAEAVRHGFGKGEVSASMSNWRSLPNIGAPLLCTSAPLFGVPLPCVCIRADPAQARVRPMPSLWPLLTGTPNWHALPCSVAVRYADAAVYNWGAQPSVNFPKALFLSRMILGAIIPEITFRCIPTKERQRLSTDS